MPNLSSIVDHFREPEVPPLPLTQEVEQTVLQQLCHDVDGLLLDAGTCGLWGSFMDDHRVEEVLKKV